MLLIHYGEKKKKKKKKKTHYICKCQAMSSYSDEYFSRSKLFSLQDLRLCY